MQFLYEKKYDKIFSSLCSKRFQRNFSRLQKGTTLTAVFLGKDVELKCIMVDVKSSKRWNLKLC